MNNKAIISHLKLNEKLQYYKTNRHTIKLYGPYHKLGK